MDVVNLFLVKECSLLYWLKCMGKMHGSVKLFSKKISTLYVLGRFDINNQTIHGRNK